jgi:hypothetical protein
MPASRSEPSSLLKLGDAEFASLLRALPPQRQEQMLQAAADVLDCIQNYSRRGTSVLADMLGKHAQFDEWTHYPSKDAVDTTSGYRFYYHAHAANERVRREHGHFHVFGPTSVAASVLAFNKPTDVAVKNGATDYTHIVGISVDERGFPIRLFTTNRWVTAEQWLPAASVINVLLQLDLSLAKPARAARWVQGMARLFAVQIAELIHLRDARIAAKSIAANRERLFEDRRRHILSQCPIDLARQFQFLEGAGIG